MRKTAVLLLLLPQIGCATQPPRAPAVHPSLFLDQAPLHGVILNATPPTYGLEGGGGCITQSEFRIDLTDLAIAEDGRLSMAGTILSTDPRGSRSVVGARISRRTAGVTVPVQWVARPMNVLVEVGEGAVLVVDLIGHRTLYLDLTRLAAVARRRAAAGAVALRDHR